VWGENTLISMEAFATMTLTALFFGVMWLRAIIQKGKIEAKYNNLVKGLEEMKEDVQNAASHAQTER